MRTNLKLGLGLGAVGAPASEAEPEPLDAPTGLEYVNVVGATGAVNCNAVAEATGYEFEFKLTGEEVWSPLSTGPTPNVGASDMPLDTLFDLRVRATGERPTSEWTEAIVAGGVSPLEGTSSGNGISPDTTMLFQWANDSQTDWQNQVRVDVSLDNSEFTQAALVAASDDSATIEGLTPETFYYFRAYYVSIHGTLSASVEFTHTTSPAP